MTHSTGPKSARKGKISITTPDPKPVITVLTICCMPLCMTDGRIDWAAHNSFVPANFHMTLPGLLVALPDMFKAAFAELSILTWLLNGLFLWIFGYVVEKKLKSWRYPAFLFTMVITGWLFVYMNAGFNFNKLYIGPSMLLFGMLGGYFAYLPKKPHKPEPWVRPSTEIFKQEDKTPINERYFVSPWVYVAAFAVFQIIEQVMLNTGKDAIVNATGISFLGQIYTWMFGRMQETPSAFHPVAAVFQIGAGALFAQLYPAMAMSLKPKRPGGNLQLEVIQHYRELRTLDMTHEKACEGAAKFAAVPIDIAKDWIAKGAAGLKDQDINVP